MNTHTLRRGTGALLALTGPLLAAAVATSAPADAHSGAATSSARYQGASPTRDWGGYTCAGSSRVVTATYVTRGHTKVGAVQLRYSPRCGTYYAQVFRRGPLTENYWYTGSIVGGNGSRYRCQYTPPRQATGGGCYTAMMVRHSGRSYRAEGARLYSSNRQVVAFGRTPATTSIGRTAPQCSTAGTGDSTSCTQAVAWAKAHVHKGSRSGYANRCDHLVALAYGETHSGSTTAYAHWRSVPAKFKHAGSKDVPAGGLAFFGNGGAGHVMIAIGGGRFVSNDIHGRGSYTVTTIGEIISTWHQQYLGWTQPWFAVNR